MDDLRFVLQALPQIGLGGIFLWLYLRESRERKEWQERMFGEFRGELEEIRRQLLAHISREE